MISIWSKGINWSWY